MNRSYLLAFTALSSCALLFACSATGGDTDLDDSEMTASGGSGGPPGTGGVQGTGSEPGSGGVSSTGGGVSTGGDLGTGGGVGTGGGTPGTGVGCAGADILCETFESLAPDGLPSGDGWIDRTSECADVAYMGASALPLPRGASTQTLKISKAIYAPCRLAKSIAAPDDFWVRAYMYWDSNVDLTDKEVLAMELIPQKAIDAKSDDPSVRFGHRSKQPCTESPGPQVTLIGFGEEHTGCDGDTPIPRDSWYCFEAHIQQGTSLKVETYVDGKKLVYKSNGKADVEAIEAPGVTEKITHLRLGMFSTSSQLPGDIYVDDVAVASSRVGCGD